MKNYNQHGIKGMQWGIRKKPQPQLGNETNPETTYKKPRFDRDDIIDIADFINAKIAEEDKK